jgi:trehalose 6-phosphate synthase
VASNRGPLEYHLAPDNSLQPRRGSGAVVTAMNSLTQALGFLWVANAMGEGDRRALEQAGGKRIPSPLPSQRVAVRYVVTPRRAYHKFYNIVCNPLLWFLQHYMWSAPYTPNIDSTVYDAWATGYEPVNRAFADAIIEEARVEATPPLVLIHDYHLYLVAGMVRQAIPQARITHFIHVPWPTSQLWQLLPSAMRSAICGSLCAADIVGFQTAWDAHNFLESCNWFVEGAQVDYQAGTVTLGGRCTHVKVYPTSIDVEEVRRIGLSPRALEYERRTRPLCAEYTIVRVDRAEPSKNILRSFRAYQILLERHPELRGRITFLAFLVPSRTHIRQYERYLAEVDELIRSINATFGNEEWKPIQVFHENNYTQAIAGMRLYDALLVNPVADGMSLVAKEGPVINTKNGVLILSESTGAYHQLKEGALTVAAADLEGTAEAFYRAVTMPAEERERRSALLIEAIGREDATHWLFSQFQDIASLP